MKLEYPYSDLDLIFKILEKLNLDQYYPAIDHLYLKNIAQPIARYIQNEKCCGCKNFNEDSKLIYEHGSCEVHSSDGNTYFMKDSGWCPAYEKRHCKYCKEYNSQRSVCSIDDHMDYGLINPTTKEDDVCERWRR